MEVYHVFFPFVLWNSKTTQYERNRCFTSLVSPLVETPRGKATGVGIYLKASKIESMLERTLLSSN